MSTDPQLIPSLGSSCSTSRATAEQSRAGRHELCIVLLLLTMQTPCQSGLPVSTASVWNDLARRQLHCTTTRSPGAQKVHLLDFTAVTGTFASQREGCEFNSQARGPLGVEFCVCSLQALGPCWIIVSVVVRLSVRSIDELVHCGTRSELRDLHVHCIKSQCCGHLGLLCVFP